MRGFLWLEWRQVRPWLYFLVAAGILLPFLGYLWPRIFSPGPTLPPATPDPTLGQSVGGFLGIATLAFYFLWRNRRRDKLPEVLFLSPRHDLAGLTAQFAVIAAAWISYHVLLVLWSDLLARLWLALPYNLLLSIQTGLYFGSLIFIPLTGWLALFERFVGRFRLYRKGGAAAVVFLSGSAAMAWLLAEGISGISGELLPPWRILQARWPTGIQVQDAFQEPLWAALLLTLVFLGWAWALGREVEL